MKKIFKYIHKFAEILSYIIFQFLFLNIILTVIYFLIIPFFKLIMVVFKKNNNGFTKTEDYFETLDSLRQGS